METLRRRHLSWPAPRSTSATIRATELVPCRSWRFDTRRETGLSGADLGRYPGLRRRWISCPRCRRRIASATRRCVPVVRRGARLRATGMTVGSTPRTASRADSIGSGSATTTRASSVSSRTTGHQRPPDQLRPSPVAGHVPTQAYGPVEPCPGAGAIELRCEAAGQLPDLGASAGDPLGLSADSRRRISPPSRVSLLAAPTGR